MRSILNWLFVFAFSISAHSGQVPLDRAASEQEAKLEVSLKKLSELRDSIHEERLPLVRELNELDRQVEELAAEVRRAERASGKDLADLEKLRAKVEADQREVDYLQKTLLPGFVANLDAAMSPVERPRLGETMRNFNLFLENSDVGELAKLERGLALIGSSFRSMENLLGGLILEGEALGPDGRLLAGTFVQTGPLVYFSAENGDLAGLIDVAAGSFDAHLQPLKGAGALAISELARSGEGILPIDPTLGDALAVEQTRDTILEHLIKGGVWVFPILAFALAATLVALMKSIQIFSVRHPDPALIPEMIRFLKNGEKERAHQLAERQPQPAREMLAAAVEHADESTDMIEEVMYERMLTAQPKLERYLNVIAVTAAAAPLLGLLGTVTGIIKTFRLMTVFGAGDPKPLISGISEALITTELGLILAIPALVLHAILSRRVSGILARMEKTAVAFVNGLSRRSDEERVVSK